MVVSGGLALGTRGRTVYVGGASLEAPRDSLPLVTLALGLAAADAIVNWRHRVPTSDGRTMFFSTTVMRRHPRSATRRCAYRRYRHKRESHLFPAEIASSATSLRIATGRDYNLGTLLTALIEAIHEHIDNLLQNGRESVLRVFSQASSYVRGRRVIVDQNGQELTGVTDGLDPQGFLLLRKDNGSRTLILAGGVRPA